MSDKPKLTVKGSGSHDLEIILPDGTNLTKELLINRVSIEFDATRRTTLKFECVIPEDRLDLHLEGLEATKADIEVIHTYPKDEKITESLKLLEAENQDLFNRLKEAEGF